MPVLLNVLLIILLCFSNTVDACGQQKTSTSTSIINVSCDVSERDELDPATELNDVEIHQLLTNYLTDFHVRLLSKSGHQSHKFINRCNQIIRAPPVLG